MKYKIIINLLIFFSVSGICYSDSLWKDDTRSPYVRNKTVKVGDVLTVQIVESSTAIQQAQTDLSKKSGVNVDVLSAWDKVSNIISASDAKNERIKSNAEASGGDSYNGQGQTTRKSSVKSRITVMVTAKLDDNLYEVEGNHQVKVNEEVEKVYIKGYIRKQDIGNDNAVFSSQIANAQIAIEGSGSVSSKQNPGILTRMFGWLF